MGGVAFALACAGAWASLVSWSASDPAVTSASPFSYNLLGPAGALASDWVLQCLGFAAPLALFAPSTWAAELIAGRRLPSRHQRFAMWPLSVLLMAAALATVPVPQGWPLDPGLGGLFGDRILNFCTMLTGFLGPWASDLVVGLTLGGTAVALTLPLLGFELADLRGLHQRAEPELMDDDEGEAELEDEPEPGLSFGPSDDLMAVPADNHQLLPVQLKSEPGWGPALTMPPAVAAKSAPALAEPGLTVGAPFAVGHTAQSVGARHASPLAPQAKGSRFATEGEAGLALTMPALEQPYSSPTQSLSARLTNVRADVRSGDVHPEEYWAPEPELDDRVQPAPAFLAPTLDQPQQAVASRAHRPLHVPYDTDPMPEDDDSRRIAERFAPRGEPEAASDEGMGPLGWKVWRRTQSLTDRIEPTIERAPLGASENAANTQPRRALLAEVAVAHPERRQPDAKAVPPSQERRAVEPRAYAAERMHRDERQREPAPVPAAPVPPRPLLPALRLLRSPERTRSGTERIEPLLKAKSAQLETVLGEFGVKGRITGARPGPVVTLYELEPAPGLKTARVVGLADDIARSMATTSARIAAIPGRNLIGIELPNDRRETVYLRELLESEAFRRSTLTLPVAIGKGIEGEPVIADLARMPHLLVAGTTGSGKSVGINAMILSLLYRFTPEQCRLILIDPKILELSAYADIPHLLTPIVTESAKAVAALGWAVAEMEERYKSMAKLNVRNIETYNNAMKNAARQGNRMTRTVQVGFDKRTGQAMYEEEELTLEPLPYIVIVIDEMADLMLTAGKEFEALVQRLAQMARAAGIHLVAATQRPSVDVVTGVIKSNLPARLTYRVASKIDSRTVLGESGAEQLLGSGDLLFNPGNGTIRAHGPYVADEEVALVTAELRRLGAPAYVDAVVASAEEEEAPDADAEEDELYDRAVAVVTDERKVSASLLQRRLQIGYNRAAGFVDRMEQEGLIGPTEGGKRAILVPARGQ